jgi:AraC family transcriptional regulator, regulatory protein of adaptative response / DNA-3-methyladenine glycosylase II
MRAKSSYDDVAEVRAMSLDWRVCSRARLARDARFDGKFFIGVKSTRIYCRPICRSRTSKEENVRYFATAAAAAEAGYRPCLRCRPECSPGAAALAGTKNTVSRALRLISETGLEDGGVEGLAAHLGVGSRHLRRLFLRHLGATPSAVEQTRRLHFAKKLIDETQLSMTQIALASGFGSVRRFNAGMRKVYQRTPSQIRGLSRRKEKQPEDHYWFQLSYRPPYDWKRLLEFLSAWAIPGVEVVEGERYRRSIRVGGSCGCVEITREEGHDALLARVQIAEPQALFFVMERIRAMFDVDADWPKIARILGADEALGRKIKASPGLRVPGCWNGFEFAVQALLVEELGLEKARSTAAQVVEAFGNRAELGGGITHLFPGPEALAGADLTGFGIAAETAEAIRGVARAVRDRRIRFEKMVDGEAFLAQLAAMRGMGNLALQYVAMRAVREPDAFPVLDEKLASGMRLRSAVEIENRSQIWRPWRAYAAMYLWSFAEEFRQAERRGKTSGGRRAELGERVVRRAS